jgi:class 3 adenylate cyclase
MNLLKVFFCRNFLPTLTSLLAHADAIMQASEESRVLRKWLKNIDQRSLGLFGLTAQDERDYLFARIQETRTRICDLFAIVGIGFDFLLFLVRNSFHNETALWYVCNYSYGLAAIWFTALVVAKSHTAKQRWLTIGCSLTSVLCSWIIVDLFSGRGDIYPVDIAFLLSYAIVVGAFVIVMAFVSRPLLLAITMISLIFSWHLPELIEGAPNRYMACIFIAFMPLLNHALHLRMLKTEDREMRMRLSTMPRRMALSLNDSDRTPRERFCLCLSSDWRGYQDLVSGLSDEKVVSLLEDYYQRAQEIMSRELVDYDYYMDWIADELFVVIYSIETDQVNMVARQKMALTVIDLSRKILEMKNQFAKDNNLDLSIDIGLSSGQSLIGVIGPSNNKKATALGSNPGRARRLQGTGKLLRHELGEDDRIIFGDELLIVLSTPEEIELHIDKFDASDRKLRNLDDRLLFFTTITMNSDKSKMKNPIHLISPSTSLLLDQSA